MTPQDYIAALHFQLESAWVLAERQELPSAHQKWEWLEVLQRRQDLQPSAMIEDLKDVIEQYRDRVRRLEAQQDTRMFPISPFQKETP